MKRPVVVNSEPVGYSENASRLLRESVDYREVSCIREHLKRDVEYADGLIVRLESIVDKDLLENAKNLKFVASATTGLNHLDLEYLAERNIKVISLKGEVEFLSNITATAEHTWGLLLALVRNTIGAVDHVKEFGWQRGLFIGRELSSMSIGIMGFGRLGKIVAKYAKSFGMDVLVHDPYCSEFFNFKAVSKEELLQGSDIVTLHIPLNDETKLSFGNDEFNMMRPGAFLINTSRGEIVDEVALLSALHDGGLKGAALDVLNDEVYWDDIPESHELVNQMISDNRLIITPHIGGATLDSMHKTENFIAGKILQFLEEYND